MKTNDKKTWLDLNPTRQFESILCRTKSNIDQVYIMEGYVVNPSKSRRYNGWAGIIVKTFGRRLARTLNNSYEYVFDTGGTTGEFDDIRHKLISRVSTLVKKKVKRGYIDASLRMDLHIVALSSSSIQRASVGELPGSIIKDDAAQHDFNNAGVGSFINIL